LGSVVKGFDGALQFAGSRQDEESGLPVWYSGEEAAGLLERPMIESDFIYGAALFIPLALVSRVGLFDERFFLTYEETDLCYRAKALGYPSYIVTASEVAHRGSATLGPYTGPLQNYFLTRNELLFSAKHGAPAARATLLKQRLKCFARSALRSPLSSRTKTMGLGLRDYLLRRFGDCPASVRRYAGRTS
jgi:GT2 family glycosyltransferase